MTADTRKHKDGIPSVTLFVHDQESEQSASWRALATIETIRAHQGVHVQVYVVHSTEIPVNHFWAMKPWKQ